MTCTRRRTDHQEQATAENRMGGYEAGMLQIDECHEIKSNKLNCVTNSYCNNVFDNTIVHNNSLHSRHSQAIADISFSGHYLNPFTPYENKTNMHNGPTVTPLDRKSNIPHSRSNTADIKYCFLPRFSTITYFSTN